MTPKRKKRLLAVLFIVTGVGLAAALTMTAFEQNMMYFFSPTEVAEGKAPQGHNFRLGGLVTAGSVHRLENGVTVEFAVTDTAKNVTVRYTGILPDLFREGQGIVALGKLNDQGIFIADEVLAKHDENYMPPEVADALKQAGAEAPHPTGGPTP